MRGGRSGSRHHVYSLPDTSSYREPSVHQGKMCPTSSEGTAVDIVLGVSVDAVHAITVQQNKVMFQSPVGVMKEIVWNYSEKSVKFVLDDGGTSPTFVFSVLTELEAHFTAILALPDLEKPPEQIYIGVLIGQNLPSPIQQRRALAGFNQPAMLPMAKRRELLRSEQPVRNAMSRERLGLEFIRSGFLCFTCSIGSDLRGLTLGVQQLRVFPSPDCHDRSASLFSYSYENLESCEVAGTRLELRFRTTNQLAKQPSYLVFQSLESQYIREAIWYLKNGTYRDASLRELLSSPRSSNVGSHRGSLLMFFSDTDSLKQRIDACCRVIGCENLVECNDQRCIRQDEASTSNVMINYGQLNHMNPSASRVLTNGLCEFHASCLSLSPTDAISRQKQRDKPPVPKTMQPLIALLQSAHYAKMFKFQGQLLKRQNARTFHLRKTWHPKFVVLFETPVGGFLCYYDKLTHCPGMTEMPKERRIIDLSSVLCIRPVSSSSPVSRSNSNTPTMHAFDVVTLYRTWTFAALEPEQYEIWLHVLTECVEKHATIAPDKVLRFPVKLAMTSQSSPTEATSLEISSHGVSFCTGHEAEVVLSTWYYTDLEKWSVVFQQGYLCCLVKCRSAAPASPGSPRTSAGDTMTQDFLFRTTEASTICLAIEFYVGKCMAKLEVLAGTFLEESRAQKSKNELVVDPATTKRNAGAGMPKLQLQLVREHPIETVSLAPVGSPEHSMESSDLDAALSVPQKEIVLVEVVSEADESEFSTAGETRYVEEVSVSIRTLGEDANTQPLIDLEEPMRMAMHTNLPSTTSCTENNSLAKEVDNMVVEIPNVLAPTPTLQDDLDARHGADTSYEKKQISAEEEICLVQTSEDYDDFIYVQNQEIINLTDKNLSESPEISTKETLSDGTRISTQNGQTSPAVSSPPPLLLLTFIPSWPYDDVVNQDKTDLPVPPPEEVDEDDRMSECGVSDQTDAFDSCTSEVEPFTEAATSYFQSSHAIEDPDILPPLDCSDEVFEDAKELLDSITG